MRLPIFIVACLFRLTNQALAADQTPLEHLAADLTGSFSSTDQARGDPNFRDASLHIAPIWTERIDGRWLYLEQALTDALEHPYRQFIYQLIARADHALEVRIFEVPDPVAATGAWKDTALLAKLTPATLAATPSCTLIVRPQLDGSFKGGTEGKGCVNTLRGASYMTSELTVTDKQLLTWERGYNAADTQVWGSVHGGYLFKRNE